MNLPVHYQYSQHPSLHHRAMPAPLVVVPIQNHWNWRILKINMSNKPSTFSHTRNTHTNDTSVFGGCTFEDNTKFSKTLSSRFYLLFLQKLEMGIELIPVVRIRFNDFLT